MNVQLASQPGEPNLGAVSSESAVYCRVIYCVALTTIGGLFDDGDSA